MNSTEKAYRKITKPIRNVIRSVVRASCPPLLVFAKILVLIFSSRSFLKRSGYFQSVKTSRPIRRDGTAIPWMNYSIIAFLEERLNRDLTLFEYGCGNSTLFYAARTKTVISLECDQTWYDYIVDNMPANVSLVLQTSTDKKAYLDVINQQRCKFDIIVVDADLRTECLLQAPASLTDRGVMILDDTQDLSSGDRLYTVMAERGFKRFIFKSLKPSSIHEYGTTLFYRDGNCLGL